MKASGMRSLFVVVICLVVLGVPARATAEGGVIVKVGHSWTKPFGKTPFESKPRVTVDKPDIASVSWRGEESGTLVITGIEEGEAVVTITGRIRVAGLGAGGGLTVKDYTAKVPVKVTGPDEYSKLVILHVKQKMSITFPKGMKLGPKSPKNSNPSVVFVRRNSSKQLTLRGKKKGESWLTFKLLVEQDGEEKEVSGTLWVKVIAGKPKKGKKRIKKGWDDLFIGEIIMLSLTVPAEEGTLDWPGTEGVYCTFVPSGQNYGDIGDLIIENDTDEAVTVTVPPGMLLDSSDPAVQDLYVADIPTESPCSGAEDIHTPITIPAGGTYVISHVPGVCPDAELSPPEAGATDIYTARPPDDKADVVLAAIDAAKKFDVGTMKLQVFEEDKAREMLCQGAVWSADSEVDDVDGNEVTEDGLADRFFDAFVRSAGPSLDAMTPEERQEAEDLVRDETRSIVAAACFIGKASSAGATAEESD